MTKHQKLETCARELIAFAEGHDYVLTITTKPESQGAYLLARDEIEHSPTTIADHHKAFNSSQNGAATTRP